MTHLDRCSAADSLPVMSAQQIGCQPAAIGYAGNTT
jgi:hypothetical protein